MSEPIGGHRDEIERELKFANVDHGELREMLRGLEAEMHGSSILEDNWVLDRHGELAEKQSVLRLRVDRRGTRLTFKGPSSFEGRTRLRRELETVVENAEVMRSILLELGFDAARRYQKYREEWRLGSVIISLDHTPIGDFAELEGEGCETVAQRCGLPVDQAERRNYLRLYEDYRKEHPEAPEDMVFP